MNTALKVDDNWLIVSSSYEEIRIGDRYVFQTVNPIGYFLSQYLDNEEHEVSLGNLKAKKVIATSKKIGELPLFDVPDWDDDGYKIAEKLYQTTSMSNQIHRLNMETDRKIFIDGYNKAKEKYQFTLEDMSKAFFTGFNVINDRDFSGIDSDAESYYHKLVAEITKPKQYQVSLEMEIIRQNQCVNKCASYPSECLCEMTKQPKITEGKVKILTWKEL